MQQDNNIENKLRDLEAMEQPELGQMDAHWQQMAGMLQPPVLPLKKGWPKWMLNGFSAAAVVLLIGAAMWFLSTKETAGTKQSDVVQLDTAILENANLVIDDGEQVDNEKVFTPNSSVITASINPSLTHTTHGFGEPVMWTDRDSILGTIKLNVVDCLNCPAKTDSVAAISNAERQLRLKTLFTQLEKNEQHFTIDNRRDTLLQFEEGTVLLVPANSFGGMNGIEITAKEFYKTSDIVANQLSTASNKDQLETGGMIYLNAFYQSKEVKINSEKPLVLFMRDTSANMKGMQLFYARNSPKQTVSSVILNKSENETTKFQSRTDFLDTAMTGSSSYLNWIPQGRYFTRDLVQTELKVLNLVNEPYLTKESSKGTVAYFIVGEELMIERRQLRKMLREKYGYYKVKLRSDFRNHFVRIKLPPKWNIGKNDDEFRYTVFNRSIGDSVWMDKATANKYNLAATATRQVLSQKSNNDFMFGNITLQFDEKGKRIKPKPDSSQLRYEEFALQSVQILDDIDSRYGVKIAEMDWINCDRFYTNNRKKVNFKVDLGDAATNYYTMLVFDKIKSMMTGVIDGNQVAFQNIPVGEPVKIISIGINQKGETVYSVTHTTTSEQELKAVQFETTTAPDLKASLSKLDK